MENPFSKIEQPNREESQEKEIDKVEKEALEKVRRDFLSEKLSEIKYAFRPDQEPSESVQGKTIFEAIGEKRSGELIDYLLGNKEIVELVDKVLDESKGLEEEEDKRLKFLIKDSAIKIKTGRLEEKEEFEKAA